MSSEEELDLVRSTIRGALGDGADLAELASLGLLGLLVTEDRGGVGWSPVEAAVVADEVGRAASIYAAADPKLRGTAPAWLGSSIAAGALGVSGGQAGLLASTIAGDAPAAAAGGRLQVDGNSCRGALVGVDIPATSTAVVVVGADASLHLVGLAGDGVNVRSDPTSIDTTRPLQRVDLDGAPVEVLGTSIAIRDAARVLAAATSAGSLRTAIERLVPYLTHRVAFGAPIASFQAIQHRIVDLTLLEIRLGVAVDAAARALAADPAGASRLAAVAHALAVEHVPPALDECIQLTGGIGFTWEYPLHHELRRSVGDGTTFGSSRDSRESLLEMTGWV